MQSSRIEHDLEREQAGWTKRFLDRLHHGFGVFGQRFQSLSGVAAMRLKTVDIMMMESRKTIGIADHRDAGADAEAAPFVLPPSLRPTGARNSSRTALRMTAAVRT